MLPWFFGGFAVFFAVLIGCATHGALFRPDERHRADAFRVLRFVWGTATGGFVALAIQLRNLGVI
ncbi:hypothetical protein AB0N89_01405 [Amycolatopsis sp. NPDC089917]|uniref:hypothetical protein n=1 Tax=Amycolatopsis sp. NPDC089917 TaxID=3155187 RepID=UPI003449DD08